MNTTPLRDALEKLKRSDILNDSFGDDVRDTILAIGDFLLPDGGEDGPICQMCRDSIEEPAGEVTPKHWSEFDKPCDNFIPDAEAYGDECITCRWSKDSHKPPVPTPPANAQMPLTVPFKYETPLGTVEGRKLNPEFFGAAQPPANAAEQYDIDQIIEDEKLGFARVSSGAAQPEAREWMRKEMGDHAFYAKLTLLHYHPGNPAEESRMAAEGYFPVSILNQTVRSPTPYAMNKWEDS